MNRQKLVVVGNGMAGCRAVEEILKRDPDRYEIAIFGAEPRVNYNRIMLSPVLAGEKTFEDIVINDEAWYRDNGITLHAGRAVLAIDPAARTVAISKLLIGTQYAALSGRRLTEPAAEFQRPSRDAIATIWRSFVEAERDR